MPPLLQQKKPTWQEDLKTVQDSYNKSKPTLYKPPMSVAPKPEPAKVAASIGKPEPKKGILEKAKEMLKTTVKDTASPFLRATTNVIKAGQETKNLGRILTGKETVPVDRQAPIKFGNFFGEQKPIGQSRNFVKDIKDATGEGLKAASTLIPGGKAVAGIGKATFKGLVKEGLKTGVKTGALGGAGYGAGNALTEDKGVGGILKDAAVGGLTGAAVGGAIGGILPVAGKTVNESKKLLTELGPQGAQAGFAKNPFSREVDQLRTQYEIARDTLENHPAKGLVKYANQNSELPEVVGGVRGKFGNTGDDIVTQHGFSDSETARNSYQDYLKGKKKVAELEAKYKEARQKVSEEAMATVQNKEVAFPKVAKLENTLERAKNGKSFGMRPDKVKLSQEGMPLALSKRESDIVNVTKDLNSPAEKLKAVRTQLPKSNFVANNIKKELKISAKKLEGTLEGDSIAKIADNNNNIRHAKPLIDMTSEMKTPLKNKVNILDYMRTPDRVLKKIGMGKEATLVRNQYDKYLEELPKNIDKITEWSKQVTPEGNNKIFKFLDGQKDVILNQDETRVAYEIQDWLAEWANRLNLLPESKISNYITHIFEGQLAAKEFDEDLAKIISSKIPGSVYDPFTLKRLGQMGYVEDTWRALEAYVKRGTRKVHMDPALSKLEDAASGLEESQWNYVKRYADRINLRPTELDNLIDNKIKQSPIGYKLGQRPVASGSRFLRQTTFRGMLGGNLSSAMRNLSQGVNTYAKLGEKHTALGYVKLLTQGMDELKAQGILRDNFIQDRTLSAGKNTLQKIDKALWVFFDTAEKINRGAAYYGAKSKALAKGMSEGQAIDYAKKIVRDTQFLYGSVDTPVAMQGDIVKVFTQFMTYPVKQTEFLAEMAKNKEFAGLARYAAGGMAFVLTMGKLFNMDPKELIPFADYASGDRKFGAPPSLKLLWEIAKAGMNTNDEYGNPRDFGDKIGDVGKEAMGWIPGGSQIKKTYQGVKTIQNQGSYTKSGNLQYDVEPTLSNKLRAGLFGKYSLPEAQEYYDKKEEGNTDSREVKQLKEAKEDKETEAKKRIRPIYKEVQDLKNSGNEVKAQSIVDALSEEDYEVYKSIKTSEKTKSTNKGVSAMYDTAIQVKKLKEEGNIEKATAIVEGLSEEEYKWYKSAKKQLGY